MQVTRKLLDGEDMQELKIKFYKLMIEYHCLSEKDAFEIAQHYHQIYDTAIIKVVTKIHPFTWLSSGSDARAFLACYAGLETATVIPI